MSLVEKRMTRQPSDQKTASDRENHHVVWRRRASSPQATAFGLLVSDVSATWGQRPGCECGCQDESTKMRTYYCEMHARPWMSMHARTLLHVRTGPGQVHLRTSERGAQVKRSCWPSGAWRRDDASTTPDTSLRQLLQEQPHAR